MIKQLWTGTVIVHGRLRQLRDQGSVERANGDFKNVLYAGLKDVKKAINQWISELPYVEYTKNKLITVVLAPPHIVYPFGGYPLT